jgi:SHS2 domain-containing protein
MSPLEVTTPDADTAAWLEEHVGELTLKVRAPTLPALFATAGEALAGLMLGEVGPPSTEAAHDQLELEAADRAALLVAWLNELIGRAEISHVVFTRLDVRDATEHRIPAEIHGVTPALFRSPVKAASYHRLAVDLLPGRGYVATVVLDL